MKKLILFIHGLNGNEETWGDFGEIIKRDEDFDESYSVEFHTYDTAVFTLKSILPHFGWWGKALALFAKSPPKIQEISQLLKSEIDNSFNDYQDIYLVVHSMGGLVALKYLVDELNYQRAMRVKKVLLYDVPIRGSYLANISKVYNHSQINSLDKSSDFLDFLTSSHEFKTIQNHTAIKCVICSDDIVVDRASAMAHFDDVEWLKKTHTSIVKPDDRDDISYKTFKNFIIDTEEKLFLAEVFDIIKSEIVVLLHQKHTHISQIVEEIYEEAKNNYNFYHFVTPTTKNRGEYYQRLGELFGISIKNSTEFVINSPLS